jgi:putative PIN family toxin of toxin-antitoxin system
LEETDKALKLPRIRRYLREPRDASLWLADIAVIADVIEGVGAVEPVTRDPDDDVVLAGAVAGRADVIVTGDEDLLVLRQHEGIPIVTPRKFLSLMP